MNKQDKQSSVVIGCRVRERRHIGHRHR